MLYPNFQELAALKNFKLGKSSFVKQVICHRPGDHHSPFRGHGLEFDAVREYVSGDDVRRIDWRVTARMGTPHLKILKEDRERERLIVVDMNQTMRFGTKKTFKSIQAAKIAALLGWQGIKEQDKVGACLYGDVSLGVQFYSPKKTSKSFCSILKALSDPPQELQGFEFEKVLNILSRSIKSGSLVYFISDFLEIQQDFQEKSLLSRLSKTCDVIFIALHDPMERSLYPMGPLGFSSKDSNCVWIDTSNQKGRLSYEEDWKYRRKKLYNLASDLNISVIELSTESDVHKDLYLGLKQISRR